MHTALWQCCISYNQNTNIVKLHEKSGLLPSFMFWFQAQKNNNLTCQLDFLTFIYVMSIHFPAFHSLAPTFISS